MSILSQTLEDCQERAAQKLKQCCTTLDSKVLADLTIGIKLEIVRAYQLGAREVLNRLS